MKQKTFHGKINERVTTALSEYFHQPIDRNIIVAGECGYHAGYGDCFNDVYAKLMRVFPGEADIVEIIKIITETAK